MKNILIKFIPDFIKPLLKKLYYLPIDTIDWAKGRDSMIPPKSKIFIGKGDFEDVGKKFKFFFIDLGGLQPNEKVLDVGCGIGRMAVPLTGYLSKEGEYCGFDIVKEGVAWCQSRISPKFSNFHFLHSDVYNKRYNKKGKILARDYVFPFDDDLFDFVFLTSVFTHMLSTDLEHYLSEISRVLKPGGKCFITFFILNEESEGLINAGKSTLDFKYEITNGLSDNAEIPESAIAYDQKFINKLFEKCGLSILQPIHYGSWCQRDDFLSYQDIIISKKSI